MSAGYRGYAADYTLPDGRTGVTYLPRRCASRNSRPYRWAVMVLEPKGPVRHSVHATREAAEASLASRSRTGFLGHPKWEAVIVELRHLRHAGTFAEASHVG